MSRILKRTSFGLLRTNPKLTTNIKIIADSKNKVYLESIDADPLLSKSTYKGFEVTGGSYSRDLKRFYNQGTQLPKSIAYTLYEEDDSTDVKNRYNNQYDFTYGMGMQPKNSRLYTEEFSLFFPLWVERDNIPDYFLIFKLDGPVTFNANDTNIIPTGTNLDTDPTLNDLVIDPALFFENYLKKAKIIKTIDLTYRTEIGSYIRRHVEDPLFPESSIYAALDKGNLSYWQGISYDEGGFCKKAKDIYKDYVLVDKTIIENDDFITMGFQDNSVVHPNILNLEFLFDDEDQENYKFSRYFGMYVSEAELGKFIIDGNRLFEDKDNENLQIPRPIKNDIGYAKNSESQIQTNERGIKVYPHVGPSGATGMIPYSGRLITFSETQNPRIPYIKDTKGNIYSINSTNDWSSTFYIAATGSTGVPTPYVDTNYLRLKNTSVDWSNFSGLDRPFSYIDCMSTIYKGKASFSFKVTGDVTSGDEIRIKNTDWTDPIQALTIDNYTLRADSSIPAGNNVGLSFSTNGTLTDIAKSIVKSINYIQDVTSDYQVFQAISIDNEIIVFIPNEAENWNKMKYSVYSSSPTFPFTFPDGYTTVEYVNYLPSPVSLSSIIPNSKVYQYHFVGANTNPKSRIIVERNKIFEFRSDIEPVYVKTLTGFEEATQFSLYLDKPIKNSSGNVIGFEDFSKYYVIELNDNKQSFDINSSKKVGLYKTLKNTNGYLSIFPVRDFDFDFHDESYSKDADSSYTSLYSWYQGVTGPSGNVPFFQWGSLSATGQNFITSILGPTSSFAIGGGFQRLNGLINDYDDTNEEVVNEYDRLKENVLPELALSSRVVPFINKWVYDNECVDIRENGYRLNTDQAFGFSNFSPSFDEFSRNSKFFTHEWYYLQKYPPYMSFTDKVNSYSYFDEDINFPSLPLPGASGSTAYYATLVSATGASANLLSTEEDYFLSYFTRESIDGYPIPRDFKYSLFAYGDNTRYSETLFRGAKVTIKDRSEFSPINYNMESLKFLANPIYNGYKYSAVLTYGNAGTQITCIKNDKWKSVTTVIQANVGDLALSKYTKNIASLTYRWGATGASVSGRMYSSNMNIDANTNEFYINVIGNSPAQNNSAIYDSLVPGSIIELVSYTTPPYRYQINSVNLTSNVYTLGVEYISGPIPGVSPGTGSTSNFNLYEPVKSFIDRSLLYTIQNSLQVDPLDGDLVISDTTLSGAIVDFTQTGIDPFFTVIGGDDSNGNLPNFTNEIVFNQNGGYNDVYVGSLASTLFIFQDIYDVTPNTFKCKSIVTNLPNGGNVTQTLLPSGGNGWTALKYYIWNSPAQQLLWSTWDAELSSTLYYDLGGYNAYQSIIDGISFAKISDGINGGDPEIRYISVTENGNVEFDKFCLEIVRPDTPTKSSYLKSIPLKNKPVDLQTAVRILGYEITNEDRLAINQITRYRGGYNPKWRDIFKFVDTDDIKNERLDYNNIQILTRLPHIIDNELALMKNAYFNKVNVENPNVILRSSTSSKNQNLFPLIGEMAIDYSDYFLFRSNWDPFYFRKYIKSQNYQPVIGTREPKEEKAFFASKVIAIPSIVTLETFPQGVLNSSELVTKNQISKYTENIVRSEKTNKNGTILNLEVYTDLALADFLMSQGFSNEFIKYINPNYSFGDPILDDDIKSYILENIKQRYVVKNIIFWEKFWNAGDSYPEIQTNMTDAEKIANGYSTSRSFSTRFANPDDLNFQLIYNIPQDKNFSIAFTVILEKK